MNSMVPVGFAMFVKVCQEARLVDCKMVILVPGEPVKTSLSSLPFCMVVLLNCGGNGGGATVRSALVLVAMPDPLVTVTE